MNARQNFSERPIIYRRVITSLAKQILLISKRAVGCGLNFVSLLFVSVITITSAQTTEFTFQSRQLDNNLPPTANYDIEFRLFDIGSGGAALETNQPARRGGRRRHFSDQLDFGDAGSSQMRRPT